MKLISTFGQEKLKDCNPDYTIIFYGYQNHL